MNKERCPIQPFFTQLKACAATIDKRAAQYRVEIANKTADFCYPKAMKIIAGLTSDTNQLMNDVHSEVDRQMKENLKYEDILLAGNQFIKCETNKLSALEGYMKKYGFKTWDEVNIETESIEGNKENVNQELPTTPLADKQSKADISNRTPRLEDVGLSEVTLQLLNTVGKNKLSRTGDRSAADKFKQMIHIAPAISQHNAAICSSSLTQSLNETIYAAVGKHSAPASPFVLPLEIPERKNMQIHGTSEFQELMVVSGFGQEKKPDKCAHDVKAMTVEPNHAVSSHPRKRPVNIGLFQSGIENKMTKNIASAFEPSFALSAVPMCDDYTEPQEQDLNFSLETLTEMTGLYKINSFNADTPELLVKREDNIDNTTPQEPVLLVEKMSEMKIEPSVGLQRSHYLNSQVLLSEDMPQSPQLFGNYQFMKNTNIMKKEVLE